MPSRPIANTYRFAVCQKASAQANEPVMIRTLKMLAIPIPANSWATG